ncbi:hypothetical protein ACQ7HM_04515 [Williamsia sp. MIQD14]|uniref:hypothetical protein n=1 Tax=Williamsia sp. MIQD14 TaxID=3425703 RepID=UPI003DA08105
MSNATAPLRAALEGVLKQIGLWDVYRDRRDLQRSRSALLPGQDRWSHDHAVRRARTRKRAADVDVVEGMGTSAEQLRAFFDSFDIVDPGVPIIRVGPDDDGGYLLPDDLEGIVASFSPGVADEIGFDVSIADRGIPVHMIDASVPGLPVAHPAIDFEPLFLGARTVGRWTTLEDWVERRAPGDGDVMLQMDIEGHEWGVLAAATDAVLSRVRILAIEMHDLHHLSSPSGFAMIDAAFRRLNEHFQLVHVHQNNNEYPVPYAGFSLHPVVEATWLRRDRVHAAVRRESLTHPLDKVNAPQLLQHPLDPAWL